MSIDPKKPLRDLYPVDPIKYDEVDAISEMLGQDTAVKELVKRFGATEQQATVAFYVACGDNIYEACEKVYKVKTRRRASELMTISKFRECLDYLSSGSFIDERIAGLKLHLLYFGIDKMTRMRNDSAIVRLWKTLMSLAYEGQLPDSDQEVGKALAQLTDHYKESEKAKQKIVDNLKKADKEKE